MKRIQDPSAGLHRTIAHAFVVDGTVLWEAFMPKQSEELLLSVDQAALSTPAESFKRRLRPPACVHTFTVQNVTDAGRTVGAEMPVLDDHVENDPTNGAHASVDFNQISLKRQRRAAAAVLAQRAVCTYP